MVKVVISQAAVDRLVGLAASVGLRAAATEGERLLKDDILNRPGTGREYGEHRASEPGEPPAPDLGNLKGRTNAEPGMTREGDIYIARITADTDYAAALEFGTERVAARPFMGRLASDHAADLQQAFDKALRGDNYG